MIKEKGLPIWAEAIIKYVNENQITASLFDDSIPVDLKTSGTFFRLLKFPSSTVKQIRSGKEFKLKSRKLSSWSKNRKGVEEVYFGSPTNYAVVIKMKIPINSVIVDVQKFAKRFPNTIHKGYTNYLDEAEVIVKGSPAKITKDMVDLYIIKGEPFRE